MCDALFGGGGNSDAAEAARRDEEARQARIRAGMGQIDQTFSQFNDDYFDTRSKAYLDYATPQLEDQFAKAKEQLIFALSRGGNLNSSVAGERLADLTKQYDRNRTALADRGLALANDARSKVESARSDLVAQLQGSAEPTSGAAQAAERAKRWAGPDPFEPPVADPECDVGGKRGRGGCNL